VEDSWDPVTRAGRTGWSEREQGRIASTQLMAGTVEIVLLGLVGLLFFGVLAKINPEVWRDLEGGSTSPHLAHPCP
jgi:hypothetical protein